MVKLETSISALQKITGKKFNENELNELLFNMGLELDETNGNEIKIDITTERPDLVSAHGLSRAINAYLGKKTTEYKSKKSSYKVIIDSSVNEIRPFTVCAVIKNLKLDDDKIKEIIWVQEKLHTTFGRNRKKVAMGIYPMEKISWPITFKADSPEKIKFKPLQETKVMTGNEILEKTATGKEFAHLLKGKKKYPFFIDAKNNILSVPPIINSDTVGKVTKETKDVFIECSGFEFGALSQTLNILVCMFADLGGEIYSVELNYKKKITSPNLTGEKRKIKSSYAKEILGLDLNSKEVSKLLERMMYKITKTSKDSIEFVVPPFRTDIWHDVDVADDLLRAYGVNNIKAEIPKIPTTANILPENRAKKTLTELMVGLGFQEVMTLMLTDKNEQYTKMNLPILEHISLGKTAEQSINMVRTWLIPECIKLLVNNRDKPLPQKIFEISETIILDKTSDVLSSTQLKMSGLICSQETDFTQIKQNLVYLLDSIGIKNYEFENFKHNSFIDGRCGKIFVDGKEIGIIGEIHPQVLNNWKLEVPVSAFEIDVLKLI